MQQQGHLDLNRESPGLLGWLRAAVRTLEWNPGMPSFILVAALANAVLYHWPLYSFALANLDRASVSGALTLVTLFLLVNLVTALILALLALVSQRLIKSVCMLAAAGSAAALYFVESYGVVLDKSMMGNVVNTNMAEAAELLHPRLLVYLVVLGAVPCWLISRVRLRRTPMLRRFVFLVAALVIGIGWMYANSKAWLWFDKNASVVRIERPRRVARAGGQTGQQRRARSVNRAHQLAVPQPLRRRDFFSQRAIPHVKPTPAAPLPMAIISSAVSGRALKASRS